MAEEITVKQVQGNSQTCNNCNAVISGKYCHNCGQSASAGRINFHYIVEEMQHTVFHVDRGILFTIKELILRPGFTIKDYLAGKRKPHFKPFAFVIILGTVYGFLCYFFNAYPESALFSEYPGGEEGTKFALNTYEWIYGHYSFVMLAFMPFYALGSYIVFRKRYNYIEFLVVSSYIVGMQILIMIITYFLYYFTLSPWVVMATFLPIYIYHIWVYIQLFNDESHFIVAVKTILSMSISFIFLMITITLISFLAILFLHLA